MGSRKTLRRWLAPKHSLVQHCPNLAAGRALTAVNQLWVADLTYIRLRSTWVFLAVILDAFSRRCIGWSLMTHLRAELVIDALKMALRRRKPKPGLIHDSDRGVQYGCTE